MSRIDAARVRVPKAAGHGAGTWIKERVEAIALIPLSLWAFWAAAHLAGAGYQAMVEWLRQPLNAVLLALFVLISVDHMRLGLRVVVEDYIHRPGNKAALLLLNLFVCGLIGALALFAILKVALSGPANTLFGA
ncbi:succinate dehydrogenase, hydrophobic membrane anchor protein [Brevundimonas sp. 2R-24]|uniref:Succinate dehydrogenase hydrophobic membrane anchor subunit n=1 Tax=Peiella sedimenti TaxID=3061083 RepID=A0ABT8SL73_9CAUL|nr:succinate dehydrogenase, hydrophobic membrane anchor protein [Caulobacteraceae bacterium XZ-24]